MAIKANIEHIVQLIEHSSKLDQPLIDLKKSLESLAIEIDTNGIPNNLDTSNIPGTRDFLEGNFRSVQNLEKAYSELRMTVSAGPAAATNSLLDKIRDL